MPQVDLTTCSAYIGEECSYTGDRLTGFEPPAGDLDSIASCQAWAAPLVAAGVNHFHFYAPLEECRLYSTLQASCDAIGGPKEAPSLDTCEGKTG